MSFGALIAAALSADLPVAMVGVDADGVELAASIAESLGRVVVRIDAGAIGEPARTIADPRSKRPHVLIVEGCSKIGASDEAGGTDRTPEDALLDLAFDGDAALPSDCTVVMCFDDPTPLSDALAEETIPCTVLSPDMATEEPRLSIAARVADEFGIPAIDRAIAGKAEDAERVRLPDAA